MPLLEGQTTRNWTANGYLLRCDDGISCTEKTEVASTTIGFTISGYGAGTPSGTTQPTSTWATSTLPIQITCDPNDDFFQYSLCKLANWLFIPSTGVLDNFLTLADGIKYKPPIGYWYAIASVFQGVNSTSTPQFSLTGVSEISIFNTIRTALIWIFWLFFGVYIFNRIKHLDI